MPVLAQIISNVAPYEGRKHFVVSTETATYFLDSLSGGLARMIDSEGRDWIAYRNQPWGVVPGAAASSFRGVPNLVYQGDDGGVGHPGWDKCSTRRINDSTYDVTSHNRKWSFIWYFTNRYAQLELVAVDTSRCYWFLYEGPVSRRFLPRQQYWATSTDSVRRDTPNIADRSTVARGQWRWAYFGDDDSQYILFAGQQQPDDHEDFFAYMGDGERQLHSTDGMVVFGFGRSNTPQLKSPNRFFIGFLDYPDRDHKTAARRIESILSQQPTRALR
jgi:hypothetical protein